jgi:hypothetical protein
VKTTHKFKMSRKRDGTVILDAEDLVELAQVWIRRYCR